ncbi:hypothetical protein BGW38_006533 [Lunasporangiospora selenospora]|uniref:Cyclin N-terminal domain-containing protein n=1 Tax=Lunasporangiospora selenospora TaxID=979761 RepID=A0A9P6KAS4_9FUNG|nr:hypothetical protein BGW38_006533 [Lunasporangiospora selenospora]
MHCTCHRVFLASLIVAAKYLNDQSPKNKHWSAHSTVFSVGEVNLMEKQLLGLLDFDLRITEADLASSLHEFMQLQQQSATTLSAELSLPSRYVSASTAAAAPAKVLRKSTSNSSMTSINSTPSILSLRTPSPRNSYHLSSSSQILPLTQPNTTMSSRRRSSTNLKTLAQMQHHSQQHMLTQQQQQHYSHGTLGSRSSMDMMDSLARRRPSLPNQPCLEEGEIMPVYKGPVRGGAGLASYHYPSPDGEIIDSGYPSSTIPSCIQHPGPQHRLMKEDEEMIQVSLSPEDEAVVAYHPLSHVPGPSHAAPIHHHHHQYHPSQQHQFQFHQYPTQHQHQHQTRKPSWMSSLYQSRHRSMPPPPPSTLSSTYGHSHVSVEAQYSRKQLSASRAMC